MRDDLLDVRIWPPRAHSTSALAGCMLPLRAYGVSLASMLAGASVVHNIYKPDLTIPGAEAPAEPTPRARR